MQYEVGKYYLIPCIKVESSSESNVFIGNLYFEGYTIPIFDNLHNDLDILNVNKFHYHVDWRFVSEKIYRKFDFPYSKEGNVIWADEKHPQKIIYKKMKCKRLFEYDMPRTYAIEFYEKYKKAKLIKGHICPHKLADLSSVTANEKGLIICPLHGLKFCNKTKKVVKP